MEPTDLGGPLFESFFWIQAVPLATKVAGKAAVAAGSGAPPAKPVKDINKDGRDGAATAAKAKNSTVRWKPHLIHPFLVTFHSLCYAAARVSCQGPLALS